MKSLKDYIEIQLLYGLNDIEIIQMYLSQEGMGDETFKLLYSLLDRRIKDLEKYENDTKALLSMSTGFYYKVFDNDTASKLDTLTRKMQLNLEFNDKDLEFMRTFDISKIKGAFWRDLGEAIKASQDENYKPEYYNYKR